MTYLTPQAVTAAPPTNLGSLELNEIQGDVLLGLQKFYERFLLFHIVDIARFKTVLKETVAPRITSTAMVHAREFQLRDLKAHGASTPLPMIGVNIAFTDLGIQKLVPGSDLGDPSFKAGAAARAADKQAINPPGEVPILPINDPLDGTGKLSSWMPPFLDPNIDGILLITGGTDAAVNAEANAVLGFFGSAVTAIVDELGNTRPGTERGHEHFGWLDGVSQPGIKGLSNPFPGQDLLDPGLFVFGYPSDPEAVAPSMPVAWMKNGSFMVLRRLQQLVPEFNDFVLNPDIRDATGRLTPMDPVLLGARMVGRWKSGAPLATTPVQDDPAIGGDTQQNNNFDFSDDPGQRRCPFSAHIRKTNPRADLPPGGLNPRRIIRAGIPFGPEVSAAEAAAKKTQQQRGLMFVCYQTSILRQFEFLQGTWANNPSFVSPAVPKPRPDGGGAVTVGIDPIIGQAIPPAVSRSADEPIPNYPSGDVRSTLNLAQPFIVPTGGAYFFVPSISALSTVFST